MALESSAFLTDYANNARNATSAEPQQVLIVFDTRLSRKASRYFRAGEPERRNILAELQHDETGDTIATFGVAKAAVPMALINVRNDL